MDLLKWLFSKKEKIENTAIKHSCLGTYNKAKTRLVSGGHGQQAIRYMKRKGIDYNVNKTYSNGVRVGNVTNHKNKLKKTGNNQSWFPKWWNNKTIKRAGQVTALGKKLDNGKIKVGYYGNVKVGIIRTNGKIATIFPLCLQTNKKGIERKWI